MASIHVLSVDYGASSGRGVVGAFNGHTLTLKEAHRFPNGPVNILSGLYWDTIYLYKELLNCLLAANQSSTVISSIGIDGWAQDFGILDSQGHLLGMPHHYRDPRTLFVKDHSVARLSEAELFALTGKSPSSVCTLIQLLAMQEKEQAALEKGKTLLFMPNLLSYFLTGEISCDVTLASASMLYDLSSRNWSRAITTAYKLPDLFPEISKPGQVIGHIKGDLIKQAAQVDVPVISVAQHDTISAILAVEAKDKGQVAFISCGTWSIIGTTIPAPVLDMQVMQGKFCHESGFYTNDCYLLKYVTGLWILQECMQEWKNDGYTVDYRLLQTEAMKISFQSAIDVEMETFAQTGNMNGKITEYCRKTGQPIPQNRVEIYACIVNGLALKYAETITELQRLTGVSFTEIHIVGGGSRDHFLCQHTARLTGIKVIAGPQEASVVGNALVQLISLGEIRGLREASHIMRNSFTNDEYYP